MKPEDEALSEIISKVCGKAAAVLVPLIKDKENVDEFKVADKAEMTINELRNILYKLHDENLVSFIRKKDKKKGWYIYYWTLDKEKSVRALIKEHNNELTEYKNIFDNLTKKNYFVCSKGHTELSEESAMEQNFECMECGELLVLKDKEIEGRRLKKLIVNLDGKVSVLQEIVDRYVKIRVARKERELKKAEEEKKRLRQERAKERAAERAKLNKGKQKAKKPTKKKSKTATKKSVKEKVVKKIKAKSKKPTKKKSKTATKKSASKKPTKKKK